MAGDEKKCLDAGCDDYLSKPINREELFETLSRHLPCRDTRKEEHQMRNEPTETSPQAIDSITEQVDRMSRLVSDDLPGQDAASTQCEDALDDDVRPHTSLSQPVGGGLGFTGDEVPVVDRWLVGDLLLPRLAG